MIDAYRTLGLQPGATPAEVKRAYRRLAKAFHPDSAGPAALPRFLAIQEAYDALTGDPKGVRAARPGAARSTAASPGSAGPAGDPWRADPARARAAREQARARGRTAPGGAAAPPGGKPGTGARPGTPGSRAGAEGTGGGSRAGAPGGSGRRRSTRKATLGSTSYDEARDSTDTTWAGASWYGPTSGEYWRVNPREYADPRKHGPEYQSRARRQSTTAGEAWDPAAGAAAAEAPAAAASGATGASSREASQDRQSPPPPDEAASAAFARASGRRGPGATAGAGTGAGARRYAYTSNTDRTWSPPPRDARPRPSGPADTMPGVDEAFASIGRLFEGSPHDPVRRLGYALVAWFPIGFALAAVIGSLTGCASYAAACTGAAPLLPWLAQALVLGLLLLMPPLARILAAGSAAVIVAVLPLTAFIIAFGGRGEPTAPIILEILFFAVWVLGVGVALYGSMRGRLRAGEGRRP